MPYTDLLRVTVFLAGAEATVLGAISAISVGGEPAESAPRSTRQSCVRSLPCFYQPNGHRRAVRKLMMSHSATAAATLYPRLRRPLGASVAG